MSNNVQKFIFKEVEIFYDLQNIVQQVTVNSNDLSTIFSLFNESNYNAVGVVYIPSQLVEICFKVFDAVEDLLKKNKFPLSVNLSDYLFQQFTILWQYYLQHERQMMGTQLWQRVLEITWKWEGSDKAVHKGTPYFFLGGNQLMQGNVDNAFLFIHNAMEEDKRYSIQIEDPLLYTTKPAYLSSSLLVDDPRNYLHPYVRGAAAKMQDFINKYNSLLGKSFTYQYFDEKFLQKQEIEEVKFFFVYNLFVMRNHDNIDHKNLRNNDFSKLRNVDVIFNLCLIIDEVMKKKTNEKYIRESVKKICRDYLNEQNAKDIFESLNFENNFENAVNTCLSMNYSYDTRNISKEVLILLLVWGLRNFGGHRIEVKQLFVIEYESIMEKLMSALFITLEKLY